MSSVTARAAVSTTTRPDQDGQVDIDTDADADTDTDTKLALLASLLEPATFPLDELLEALQAAHGEIGPAAESLLIPRVKSAGKRKAGSSLSSWLGRKRGGGAGGGSPQITGATRGPTLNGQDKPFDDDRDGRTREFSPINHDIPQLEPEPAAAPQADYKTGVDPPKPPVDLMSLLRQSSTTSPTKPKSKNPPRPPIPLPNQAAIDAHHLPLTILRTPISPALASALYLTMMDESETWERNRFYLAGKWVESPHTVCHYAREQRYDSSSGDARVKSGVDGGDGEIDANAEDSAKSRDEHGTEENGGHSAEFDGVPDESRAREAFAKSAESLEGKDGKKATYMWSGQEINPPREYPRLLKQVADLVEPIINQAIRERSRYPLEWAGDWKATICGTNRYDGASSGVGWHADQMTYLGPYTTIASLSLGTARAFRLRPTDTVDASYAASSPTRTYEVNLGHNSLVLMNAGCQERYKHTVPTQKALDVYRPTFDIDQKPIPLHEQKTYTARINITFRYHRPDLNGPFGQRQGTPYCKCGIPTLLRADQKAKARARLPPDSPSKRRPITTTDSQAAIAVAATSPKSDTSHGITMVDDDMLFFWQCQSPGQTGDMKGCGFFRILDMRKEGRGPCVNDVVEGRWRG